MVKLLLEVVVAIYGGAGGYTTGYGRTITKDINSRASTYNIPRINGIWLNGGSGYGFLGKIIMGGSGYGGSVKKTGDSVFVKYGIGGGYFEIGYIPFSLKPISFFTMLGIGGYAEEITIGDVDRPSNWNDVWERYKNETHLKRGSFSISPSLGILFFSQKFPLGVMLGITYNTIFSKKWKYDNEKSLSSGPKSPTGGFSVRLTILSGGVGYGK